jgi:hypothetical protein
VGDLKSPSSLLFRLNVFTTLSLTCSCSGNPSGFLDTPPNSGQGRPPGDRSSCNLATPAIQTEELDVGFYSPEARTSIKSPCPCVSS